MKSRLFYTVAVCSLAVIITACGSKGASTPAPNAAATKPPAGAATKASAAQPTTASTAATAAPTIQAQAPKANSDGSIAAGFNMAVAAPDQDHADAVGLAPSIALNAAEDPMVAYLAKNLTGEGYTLNFVQWDRSGKSWTKPVAIDVVSDTFHFSPQLKLARDASNNALGVAYQQADGVDRLALSTDNGASWKVETITPTSGGHANNPSLAMSNGTIYVAATIDDVLTVFSRNGTSGAFTEKVAPSLPDTSAARNVAPGMAVDSAGRPAVAYFLAPTEGYTVTVAFWRPDEAQAYVATDSVGVQNDDPNISLAFDGTQPRVAINLTRSQDDYNTGSMYVVTSADGKTWNAPIHIQKDGGASMDSILSLAVSPQAGAAIITPSTGGSGGDTCGAPKLIRSSDLNTWVTCSPDTDRSQNLGAEYGSAAFDSHGVLYTAFMNSSIYAKLPPGLYVWRAP